MTSKVSLAVSIFGTFALAAVSLSWTGDAAAQQRGPHPQVTRQRAPQPPADQGIRRPDEVRQMTYENGPGDIDFAPAQPGFDYVGPVHGDHFHGAGCGCGGGATCGSCNQCESCCPCGPSGSFWIRGEYLMFWTSGMRLPPLVTTTNSTDPGDAALSSSNAIVLVGNEDILDEVRNGVRIRFGKWFDDCECFGIEGEYFGIENDDYYFHANGFDYDILGRPFIDVSGVPAESLQDVAIPSYLAGAVTVTASTELHSAGIRLRFNRFRNDASCNDPCAGFDPCISKVKMNRLDFIAGYRFLYLSEQLRIHEELAVLGDNPDTSPDVETPIAIDLRDDFFTRNEFHGGELGLVWEHCRERWSFEFLAKVALGSNRQWVNIQGQTQFATPGTAPDPDPLPGGLLAQPSNIGVYERSDFSAIPEFGATFFYHMNDCMRLSVGYTFIYWGNVVRPGEQIDRRVNPDFLVGDYDSNPQLPEFNFHTTDFWIQGLSLGFDYTF